MTNHDSRAMVFKHNQRQVEEQKRARSGINEHKQQTLRLAILSGDVDIGPMAEHRPIDPNLRPNLPNNGKLLSPTAIELIRETWNRH